MVKKKRQSDSWSLKRALKLLVEWVPNQKTFQIDSSIESLEKILAGEELEYPIMEISSRLAYMGSWHGSSGCLRILEGDSDGWRDIQGALRFWTSSAQIMVRARQLKGQGHFLRTNAVLCLAHSIAVREDSLADWLGQSLLTDLGEGGLYAYDWSDSPLQLLMIQLYANWRNIDLDIASRGIGSLEPYDQLLAAWESPGEMVQALESACDFHCLRSPYGPDRMENEFVYPPYDLFPAEILAIRRLREDEGLPTPEIEHKLLDSPFSTLPDPIPEFEYELLDRALDHARQELPGL